jgi:hypothetical protein
MDFSNKVGSDLPTLKATLKKKSGAVISLALATSVQLRGKQVVSSGSPIKFTLACTIVSAANGKVEFSTASLSVGTYEGEFVITWQGGAVQVVPNEGYFSFKINANLA